MKKQILISVIALMSICMTACAADSTAPNGNSAVDSAAEAVTETTAMTEGTGNTSEQAAGTEDEVQTTASPSEDAQQTAAKDAVTIEYAAIAGEWVRSDSIYADNYLSIDASGRFTVENVKGVRFSGTVKSENGTYSLYKEDGSLWNSFTYQKTDSSNRLFGRKNTDTDKIHYEDINENDNNLEDVTFVSCDAQTALLDICGDWHEPIGDGLDYHTMKLDEKGSFTFTASDGKVTNGLAHVTAEIHPDDSVSFWLTFCKTDGTYWEGFSIPNIPYDYGRLSSGQDGARILYHVWDGEYAFNAQLYVPDGKTVTVRREPADDAEAVAEIKYTVDSLPFYTCMTRGWYGVMLDQDNPDGSFGYVRVENIRKTSTDN